MEERKTAAIVLGIIAIIIIFFTIIYPKAQHDAEHSLSFKNCTVRYHFYPSSGLDEDVYRAAQNKLALCLCNVYLKKPDTAVANHIINTYRQYGTHYGYDSLSYENTKDIDSLIRNRKMVFDTLVLAD